ncbi:hypothetical protein BYT27DRAFT_6634322 [Phlegmacium glaucopus]|nr:hypothetical protein BYT27DRAFT_6634322 [Phlegmacium glaucopus]
MLCPRTPRVILRTHCLVDSGGLCLKKLNPWLSFPPDPLPSSSIVLPVVKIVITKTSNGAGNVLLARRSEEKSCITLCLTDKPQCPPGQSASGSPGCWGCCH